jgi:hypothetical protein
VTKSEEQYTLLRTGIDEGLNTVIAQLTRNCIDETMTFQAATQQITGAIKMRNLLVEWASKNT